MPKQRVDVTQEFKLPVERVFAFLSEHNNLSSVLGGKITRTKEGDDGNPNGVGSVRKLQIPPGTPSFDETVTRVVPNQLIEYAITRGGQIKNHKGVQEFSELPGGGSKLRWTIAFDPKIPGTGGFIRRMLTTGLKRGLKKVDKKA
jgi:uncharacterized protein YndB with AHSA1/START domain